jgi:MazG family protein
MSKTYTFIEVVEIIRRLRSEGGCPWDNKQTLQTLRKYFLEEVYEAIDAIDQQDYPSLCEELGDSLWEILFIARIAEQEGHFTIDDVTQMLGEKMVRRHPHIFGDVKLDSSEQVLKQWAQIKLEEGKTTLTSEILEKVPHSLPALLRAFRIGERVSKVGFDWETTDQVFEKLDEETAEFHDAIKNGSQAQVEEELGDVLFTLVNLSRHLGVSPEDALRGATNKFTRRFTDVEKQAQAKGKALSDMDIEQLEALWQNAKKKE